jgi:hypothetical protein
MPLFAGDEGQAQGYASAARNRPVEEKQCL